MDFFKKIIDLAEEIEALDENLFMIGDPATGKLYKIKKENVILSGSVSGVGTGGYIPLWISGSVIGTSALTQDSSNIVINGRALKIVAAGGGAAALRFSNDYDHVMYNASDYMAIRSHSGLFHLQSWGGADVAHISPLFLRFVALVGSDNRMLYTDATGNIGATEMPANNLGFNESVSDYILALSDRNTVRKMNSASANTCTVPNDTDVDFPIGSQLVVTQKGVGQTEIVAASGVTIDSADGALKLRTKFSSCTLIKEAANHWMCDGDLTLG